MKPRKMKHRASVARMLGALLNVAKMIWICEKEADKDK